LELPIATTFDPDTLISVDEALHSLQAEDPSAAEVVKLHFFMGMSFDEIAVAMAISRATVFRHWAYARAWLRIALKEMDSPPFASETGEPS
jgi:DNA-directed RNA polymerase specialized sigma24 family protein